MAEARNPACQKTRPRALSLPPLSSLWFLPLALLVYGTAGSPTPDIPGWPEIATGALLLLATGLLQPAKVFTLQSLFDRTVPMWRRAGIAVFMGLLALGLARALFTGTQPASLARDVIALGFFFLPLFFDPRRLPPAPKIADALAACGVLFALRHFILSGPGWPVTSILSAEDAGLHLVTSPAILFAALWLFFRAGEPLSKPVRLLCLAAGVICLMAMAGTVQRASLAIFALTIGLWAARTPKRFFGVVLLAGLALLASWPMPVHLMASIAEKTRLAGANARGLEFSGIMALTGESLPSALFGEGWGTRFPSPAVGGMPVGYAHSFAGYLLLKTGLVGLVAILGWLVTLAIPAKNLWQRNFPLALATLAPLLVCLTLYTGYKSLECGVLLLILTVCQKEKTC